MRLLVVGGHGFVGGHLVRRLREQGGFELLAWTGRNSRSFVTREGKDCVLSVPTDLTVTGVADELLMAWRPTHVYNLVGWNGGIAFNEKYPADVFYQNTVANLNLLQACAHVGVRKVVSCVTSCAYGDGNDYPEDFGDRDAGGLGVLAEPDFLRGRPNPSVACHGYARRNVQLASHFFRKQYGLKAVCACPTTLFGEGDTLDPERTKVVGALVRKFLEAQAAGTGVVLWGSGRARRDLLYVGEAARLLVQVMAHYEDGSTPLNLGFGHELSLKELAGEVARAVGFTGDVLWDDTRPEGQFRKLLDNTRMQKGLPGAQVPEVPFGEALKRTVDDVRNRLFRGPGR